MNKDIYLPLSNEEVIKQLKNRSVISNLLEDTRTSTSVLIGDKEIGLNFCTSVFHVKDGEFRMGFFPKYSYFLKKIGNFDHELYMTYKRGRIHLDLEKDRVCYIVEVSKDDYENNHLLDWIREILKDNRIDLSFSIDEQMNTIYENIQNLCSFFHDYDEYVFVRDQAKEFCARYRLKRIIEQRDKGDDIELREKGYVKFS